MFIFSAQLQISSFTPDESTSHQSDFCWAILAITTTFNWGCRTITFTSTSSEFQFLSAPFCQHQWFVSLYVSFRQTNNLSYNRLKQPVLDLTNIALQFWPVFPRVKLLIPNYSVGMCAQDDNVFHQLFYSRVTYNHCTLYVFIRSL